MLMVLPVFENWPMRPGYLTMNTLHDKYAIPAQQAAILAQQNRLFTQVLIEDCVDLFRLR